jgi:parallel beta-helix repeat protein
MKKYGLMQKSIIIGIIFLFIGASLPFAIAPDTEKPPFPISRGHWLYVGGSGPGNYTDIQDAVDNASAGDTVFVYKGTYHGYVVITKSINLIGEEKNTTVIIGYFAYTVYLLADWVNMSGFTIYTNGRLGEGIRIDSSYNHFVDTIIDAPRDRIRVAGDHNTISGNAIKNCYIFLNGDNNIISDNTITNTYFGLCLTGYASDNFISQNAFINSGVLINGDSVGNNIVTDNTVNGRSLLYIDNESNAVLDGEAGQILLVNCMNITVQNQDLDNTTVGIQLWNSKNCVISRNTITGDHYGISLSGWNNTIQDNTITDNNDGVLVSGDNNTICGNTVARNAENSIYLSYSKYNTIIANTIANNGYCILLDYGSDFNTIIKNIITNNSHAIMGLSGSRGTLISDNTITHANDSGIYFSGSNGNTIINNTITHNTGNGVFIRDSNDNTIIKNSITSNNGDGIRLLGARNTLSANSITSNNNGIFILRQKYNTITGNYITSNEWSGIELNCSNNNTISGNSISKNKHGIYFATSTNNTVLKNNFQRNARHALFDNSSNTWDGNYWGRLRLLPKLIFGTIERNSKGILWCNIDWHPAQKPYDIP